MSGDEKEKEDETMLANPAAERRTLTIPEVAVMLGIPRSTAYDLAARDELPVPVLPLGRRRVVSRAALEEVLHRLSQAKERG